MNARGRPRRPSAQTKADIVLVFGESQNDTAAIVELVGALRPDLRVQAVKSPLVLIRDANPRDVPSRADRIASVVRGFREDYTVRAVIAHEDADCVEPGHKAIAKKIEEGFRLAGLVAIAAVPAWEIEAWWLLWPDQTGAVRKSWRTPDDYVGKQVGTIQDAKEVLTRLLRPPKYNKNNFPDYVESDSVLIARRVRGEGVAQSPRADSMSYDRFRSSISAVI